MPVPLASSKPELATASWGSQSLSLLYGFVPSMHKGSFDLGEDGSSDACYQIATIGKRVCPLLLFPLLSLFPFRPCGKKQGTHDVMMAGLLGCQWKNSIWNDNPLDVREKPWFSESTHHFCIGSGVRKSESGAGCVKATQRSAPGRSVPGWEGSSCGRGRSRGLCLPWPPVLRHDYHHCCHWISSTAEAKLWKRPSVHRWMNG